VALFANADINSRVAGTLPFYFWAFAAIATEQYRELNPMRYNNSVEAKKGKGPLMAKFALVHNFAYLLLNCITFPMEAAFF